MRDSQLLKFLIFYDLLLRGGAFAVWASTGPITETGFLFAQTKAFDRAKPDLGLLKLSTAHHSSFDGWHSGYS